MIRSNITLKNQHSLRRARSLFHKQRFIAIIVFLSFVCILIVYHRSPDYFVITPNEPCDTIIDKKDGRSNDRFLDLVTILKQSRDKSKPNRFDEIIIREKIDRYNPTLGDMINKTITDSMTNLEKFQLRISKHYIYEENDPIVPLLLHDIATLPIVDADEKDGGTEIKLNIEFPGEIFALFKPMRFPREQQTLPNHFHFSDYERHNAEIAAFHLDRLLNFRRVIPVVGRVLNISRDIIPYADGEFGDTFFVSPANNLCFYGTCKVYCDIHHPVCGNPQLLEGSFAAYIPEFDGSDRKHNLHPWKRSYSPFNKTAFWQDNPEYCTDIRSNPLYSGRRILDLMDMAVFDFLIGNQDRHHYNTFKIFESETGPILYDHGRAFGQPFFDDLLILSPIRMCCLIRESTLETLLKFHNGAKPISTHLRNSLDNDPIAPILWEPHLIAVDRRLGLVLEEIRICLNNVKTKN